MALFLYLAGLTFALISWGYLFVQAARGSLEKEAVYFVFHFLGCLAVIFISWLILVYPSDCSGLFCEIAVFLVWGAFCSILILVWPIILIVMHKKKSSGNKSNENLIDN